MSDTGPANGGWLPPAQVPPGREPPPKPPSKGPAGGWLIPAAIVVAGLILAVAVVLSRNTDGEATPPPAQVLEPPSPVLSLAPPPQVPASPADTSGDALAQENLQSVASAAQGIYNSSGSFVAATSFDLASQLPGLTFVDPITESTSAGEVSISTATTTFSAAAKSDSGTCWWIRALADTVSYGTGANCTGAAAGGAQSSAWPSPSPGVPASPSVSVTPSSTPSP